MSEQSLLRREIVSLISGGNAHDGWKTKFSFWHVDRINTPLPQGKTPNGGPVTPWSIIEHMRICQADILDFIRNPDYNALTYPGGYWPAKESKGSPAGWNTAVSAFSRDLNALLALVESRDTDLFAPLPHAPGYTLLRELLLVGDHNAYHLGQLGLFEEL